MTGLRNSLLANREKSLRKVSLVQQLEQRLNLVARLKRSYQSWRESLSKLKTWRGVFYDSRGRAFVVQPPSSWRICFHDIILLKHHCVRTGSRAYPIRTVNRLAFENYSTQITTTFKCWVGSRFNISLKLIVSPWNCRETDNAETQWKRSRGGRRILRAIKNGAGAIAKHVTETRKNRERGRESDEAQNKELVLKEKSRKQGNQSRKEKIGSGSGGR